MHKDLVLQIKDLTFFYKKDNPIYKDFSLELKKGELVTIFGKSGSGAKAQTDWIRSGCSTVGNAKSGANLEVHLQK